MQRLARCGVGCGPSLSLSTCTRHKVRPAVTGMGWSHGAPGARPLLWSRSELHHSHMQEPDERK